MSTLVGIVGPSGSGKSTSCEELNPEETILINVSGKPMPFKGWKSKYKAGKFTEGANYLNTDKAELIVSSLKYISTNMPHITEIIIDDAQYLMAFEFMNKATEKGFEKFTNIAKNTFDVLNTARNLRDDLNVYVLYHDETVSENYSPKRKIKTIGKLLDDKITLEGLFTIVLYTEVVKNSETNTVNYHFATQSDGVTTAKSPRGMFEEALIPNDLKLVSKKIREYYN